MKTNRLVIFPSVATDAEDICKLRNDLTTIEHLTDPVMYSADQTVKWLENLGKDSMRLTIRANPGAFLGLFRLDKIDYINKTVQVGLDIAAEHRRKGYAFEAYTAVLSYLFDLLNMHMVYLYVASYNVGAIALYEKLGFKETGRLPQALERHQKRHDYILMARGKNG